MKKQIGTPEILKKSHAHKSKKDYSRKGKKMDIRQQVNEENWCIYSHLTAAEKTIVDKIVSDCLGRNGFESEDKWWEMNYLLPSEDVKNVNLVKSDPPWEKGEGTIADYVFILEDK